MNNLKISTRLWGMIALVASLLVIIGFLGLHSVSQANDALKTVYEDRVLSLGQLEEVSRSFVRNRVLVMDMMLDPSSENVERRITEMTKISIALTKVWKEYLATYLTPDEKTLSDEFTSARTRFVDEGLLPARNAILAGKLDEAKKIYKQKISPLAPRVTEASGKLIHLQLEVSKFEYNEAVVRYTKMRTILLSTIGGGVLFAILFGYMLIRNISQSLAQVIKATEAVAEGDLRYPVPTGGTNEISNLWKALAAMQSALSRVVSVVRHGSEEVATASAEIAQGNLDLSARTEAQAGALEETASSMEELAATVKQNADTARTANELARTATSVATEGGEAVGRVVSTMEEINQSSSKIVDIIGVIDSIAFQTNILALNAAVEAARAGEQGRGFAVVASEVRNLAQRSAAAAREIKNLISVSVEKVGQGTVLVDEAGKTMEVVVTSIKRVTDLMSEISAASAEQSAGISQVGEAITQMDETTQQNAALVEQAAAAAGSLKSQADELVKAVSVFTLT